jgi:hypothetical protein
MADENDPSDKPNVDTERETGAAVDDEAAFREAFIRGDVKDDEGDADKPAPKGKKPAAAPADDADDETGDEEPDDDDEDLDLEDDDDEPDDDEDADPVDDEPAPKDADTAKRLDQVRRNEKRAREQHQARVREFEQQQQAFVAEWKPKVEAAQEFAKLKARAKSDPAGALMALGIGEDDFEEVSKIFYGLSKTGAADPKNKAAAAALRRERELRERLDASERRFTELEQRLAQRDEETTASQQVDAYMARVEKLAGDDLPFLRESLKHRPKATRARLQQLAYQMARANDGDAVSPRDVARAFEKRRRTALERDRPLVDLLKADALKPKAKGTAPIRVEDRSGRAAGGSNGGANGKRYLSDSEVIERLRNGKLDDEDEESLH